jgi:hypothetical protein
MISPGVPPEGGGWMGVLLPGGDCVVGGATIGVPDPVGVGVMVDVEVDVAVAVEVAVAVLDGVTVGVAVGPVGVTVGV